MECLCGLQVRHKQQWFCKQDGLNRVHKKVHFDKFLYKGLFIKYFICKYVSIHPKISNYPCQCFNMCKLLFSDIVFCGTNSESCLFLCCLIKNRYMSVWKSPIFSYYVMHRPYKPTNKLSLLSLIEPNPPLCLTYSPSQTLQEAISKRGSESGVVLPKSTPSLPHSRSNAIMFYTNLFQPVCHLR